MLGEQRLAPLPPATVRDFIGSGIPALVERCLRARGAAMREEALHSFRTHYQALNGTAAAPFPGVVAALGRMRAADLRLACVTNKAAAFTLPLLQKSALAPLLDVVVTADQVGRRKPDPEPFLHACRALGVGAAQAVVIGDSANDAEGARAAGCPVLLVSYGYSEGRDVRAIDCDGVVDSLGEAAERVLSFRAPAPR